MYDHPDDDVEPLFRLAGRRHRLPDTELEPIRAAVRSEWRRHVRRTVWKRRAGAAGAALAAVLVLAVSLRLGWRGPAEPADLGPLATLELQTGTVAVQGARAGGTLGAGSVVTTDADGRAALRLAAGSSLRLDVASVVRLDTLDRVTLERGAVYVDADPSSHAREVTVDTALGSVRHVGTQFEVRLLVGAPQTTTPALRVRVREGAVLVEREARTLAVDAGGELTVDAAGTVRQTEITAHGESWEWTQQAAPALDIDGTSLAVFLAWVARETGFEWQYADPSLRRAAREIVLHGSIEGLTPVEALAVVLPGCGLHHRQLAQAWVLESELQR